LTGEKEVIQLLWLIYKLEQAAEAKEIFELKE
jgi:hypothetical protein